MMALIQRLTVTQTAKIVFVPCSSEHQALHAGLQAQIRALALACNSLPLNQDFPVQIPPNCSSFLTGALGEQLRPSQRLSRSQIFSSTDFPKSNKNEMLSLARGFEPRSPRSLQLHVMHMSDRGGVLCHLELRSASVYTVNLCAIYTAATGCSQIPYQDGSWPACHT